MTTPLLGNLTNSCPKKRHKPLTAKKWQINTDFEQRICSKKRDSTNKLAHKNEMTKTNNQKTYTTIINRIIDTTTYHSTLPDAPGSSLRSKLLVIIIATAAIQENTFLKIYTDSKMATMAYKKHLLSHKTPQQTLRTACPAKWSIPCNLTQRQNKHITLK
jgi:hypothetical protein